MPYLVPPVVPAGRLGETEQPVLEASGDLTLRPWLPADANDLVDAFGDPAIQRWHLRFLASPEEARAWISKWSARWRAETDGGWAVSRSSTGVLLGQVALREVDLASGHAECTYWVLPAARGYGVASRSTAELARWAFGVVGLHRLQLTHSVANEPSCRVAMRAGFTLEATMRSQLLHADGWHDMHLHARVRGDP